MSTHFLSSAHALSNFVPLAVPLAVPLLVPPTGPLVVPPVLPAAGAAPPAVSLGMVDRSASPGPFGSLRPGPFASPSSSSSATALRYSASVSAALPSSAPFLAAFHSVMWCVMAQVVQECWVQLGRPLSACLGCVECPLQTCWGLAGACSLNSANEVHIRQQETCRAQHTNLEHQHTHPGCRPPP